MSHLPYYNPNEKPGKNGYEIRANVLQLAKEYLENLHQVNLTYAKNMMELGQLQQEEYLKMIKPYTFDEYMKKAQEMYSFVEKK